MLAREVAQSCRTLCDPMDCSLSGSSVHGIFQAKVLQWIAISFSRRSSQLRNRTQVSRIAGRHFTPPEPPGILTLITIGTIKINIFLPSRNKFVYSCSIKIHALGFNELLESMFCLLLLMEAFSLQNLLRCLKKWLVSWREVI